MEILQPSDVRRRRHHRFLGLLLVGAGILLVIVAGGYYLYGWIATQELDSLEYHSGLEPLPAPRLSTMTLEGGLGDASSPGESRTGPDALPDPASLRLYPGERLVVSSWAEPWTAEPPSSLADELVEEFQPVDQSLLGEEGTLPPATRITIPAIGLEADIQELEIEDLGDSRQYETPKHVVGHIPDTANPGEVGNNWLFGHLQSPIRNEGSIFRDLPRIPDILKTGQRVYVVLDSPVASYLYEVYDTDSVGQDDLRLYDTDEATVTLVTCVPLWTYDHRLLVMARLIGFKPGA